VLDFSKVREKSEAGLVTIKTRAGSTATVSAFGGQLLSWVPVGRGEQLYLSPCAQIGAGTAIRGGAPVIFPQFADRGSIVRHGFARTQVWRLVDSKESGAEAFVEYQLQDDAFTRSIWPHTFDLRLRVLLRDSGVQVSLSCLNRGDKPFDFCAAIHSYFRVSDVEQVRLIGLEGAGFWDSAERREGVASFDVLTLVGEVDRIYRGVDRELKLNEAGNERLCLSQSGFQDVVVWNPGPQKAVALVDMPPEDHKHLICIEAAQVNTPIRLEPGQIWEGAQRICIAGDTGGE